ncbi:MAG: hypothetical protein AUK03_00530 [Anaerolineae bacterium CG2_30_64_16]|nr:MAG: hypothetical protein AUK03_00530 [Anaerolineae bacterium CG2_30_64_16]
MSAIPRDDLVRLRHMLDAAQKARRFIQGRERTDLEMDEMLSLAIVRLLEIVGEAAAHVSEPVQASLPGIPWRQITGARNRLIHGYFDVDLDIVWAILQDDLPPLIVQLEQILPQRTRPRRR